MHSPKECILQKLHHKHWLHLCNIESGDFLKFELKSRTFPVLVHLTFTFVSVASKWHRQLFLYPSLNFCYCDDDVLTINADSVVISQHELETQDGECHSVGHSVTCRKQIRALVSPLSQH